MTNKSSADSLIEATRTRARFSGHGNAKGAAGHREYHFDPDTSEHLGAPGQSLSISPPEGGFESIMIGAAWDSIPNPGGGLIRRLMGMVKGLQGVDIDLGCLYELQDGSRGAIQAFGEKFGAAHEPPYISLSGDERTGRSPGYDEKILVRGEHWPKIKRAIVYLYIYKGAPHWAAIRPRVVIDVPGEHDLYMTPGIENDNLPLCVVGGLEQVRGGMTLTNHSEYFPGHAEMDRAFGFGLKWEEGRKPPAGSTGSNHQ